MTGTYKKRKVGFIIISQSGQKVINGGSQKGAEIQRFFGDLYGKVI